MTHESAADDDQVLAQRVAQADVDALAAFLEHCRPRLMAFIHRRLGEALKTRVEADDIFQEASAEAVRVLSPEWPGDKDPFLWLCQIVERRIVDNHRHHFGAQKRDAGRERPLSRGSADGGEVGLVNLLVNSMTTPSKAFSRNAREIRLQEALASLRDEQREAIRLRYIENQPSKEIATQLGKSDAAVRVLLTRTMKQLQILLDETTG